VISIRRGEVLVIARAATVASALVALSGFLGSGAIWP
jgi:hypothetical protein